MQRIYQIAVREKNVAGKRKRPDGRSLAGFAQKPQTLPQITLISLIYTDQAKLNKTILTL
jgi:hypothetical protein